MTATTDTMTWYQAAGRLHRTWLTGDAMGVLTQLAAFITTGQDNPTHAELAGASGVCARTVRRVLTIARACGFLDWAPVFKLTRHGRRRAANRYWLRLPAGAVPARPKRQREPGGQRCRAIGSKILKQAVMPFIESADRALRLVREGAEQRLVRAWQARRRPG